MCVCCGLCVFVFACALWLIRVFLLLVCVCCGGSCLALLWYEWLHVLVRVRSCWLVIVVGG